MDLREALLTARDERGNVIVSPRDYYDTYIKNDSNSFKYSKLVRCPFHDDTDASLGTFAHNKLKDVEIYHCFGCQASGDVVTMHQATRRQHGENLTVLEAIKDLMEMYDITLGDIEFDDSYAAYLKALDRKVKSAKSQYYNIRDFQKDVDSIAMSDVDIYTKMVSFQTLFAAWKERMKRGAGNV